MFFNKCVRCGAFYATEDTVCPNCKPKDEFDKMSLKSYIANNDMPQTIEALAFNSGITVKNVNRLLETKEFSEIKNTFNNQVKRITI